MKLAVCFLGLLATITVHAKECDVKKVDDFMQCIGGKIQAGIEKWTPDLIKEKHDAIDKCFTGNGCDKPDYDRDIFSDLPPNFQAVARKMKSEWQLAPAPVKECIFKDFKDVVKTNINKCLSEQKVSELKEIPEGVVKFLKNMMAGGDSPEEQKFHEMVFTAKTNIVRSFRQCNDSKGSEATKKVWGCFQDVRKKYMFDQMCKDKTSCEKDKLDDTCIKRGKEIDEACCKCSKDKTNDLEKKVEGLRENPDADLDTVMQIVCPDHSVDEIMTKVKACYVDNKETLPTSIKLIEVMRKAKESGKGPKFQFNKATIDTIHDIARGMMEDEKCYICKDKPDQDD